jgi:hypothetical protein
MAAEKSFLEDASGFLGVGAIELVGVMMVIDGFTEFFDLVEWYLVHAAALFAVPFLALSYLLGLITTSGTALALERWTVLGPELFAAAATCGFDSVLTRYAEGERHARLLGGAAVAFLTLVAGSLAEVQRAGKLTAVALTVAGLFLILAIACLATRHAIQQGVQAYVTACANKQVT